MSNSEIDQQRQHSLEIEIQLNEKFLLNISIKDKSDIHTCASV